MKEADNSTVAICNNINLLSINEGYKHCFVCINARRLCRDRRERGVFFYGQKTLICLNIDEFEQ